MSTESQLREKLRKIEALFAGAGTAGERLAAEAALERVRARLAELGRQDPPTEMQFSCGPIAIIGNGATPSWSARRRALSIRFCGRSSPNSTRPCKPIFIR